MPAPRVVLVHGAAVTSAVWDPVLPYLGEYEVIAPERPRTGDLEAEATWLAEIARGAFVVGQSGGATLGLAVAATTAIAGAVLHEPAGGSLAPALFAPMASAFERGGLAEFGSTLYGQRWQPRMAGDLDDADLAADFAMFRSFEPSRPINANVLTTVGELSPAARHEVAAALTDRFAVPHLVVPGCAHFATHEAPGQFAAVIRAGVEAA